MSHLTTFKTTYCDRSLIEAAAQNLGFTIVEGDSVRWYSSSKAGHRDIEFTLKLNTYDVGFRRVDPGQETGQVDILVADQLDDTSPEWEPVFDPWQGHVEKDLGKNLCKFNREIDLAALERCGFSHTDPVVTETAEEIVIMQEIL